MAREPGPVLPHVDTVTRILHLYRQKVGRSRAHHRCYQRHSRCASWGWPGCCAPRRGMLLQPCLQLRKPRAARAPGCPAAGCVRRVLDHMGLPTDGPSKLVTDFSMLRLGRTLSDVASEGALSPRASVPGTVLTLMSWLVSDWRQALCLGKWGACGPRPSFPPCPRQVGGAACLRPQLAQLSALGCTVHGQPALSMQRPCRQLRQPGMCLHSSVAWRQAGLTAGQPSQGHLRPAPSAWRGRWCLARQSVRPGLQVPSACRQRADLSGRHPLSLIPADPPPACADCCAASVWACCLMASLTERPLCTCSSLH